MRFSPFGFLEIKSLGLPNPTPTPTPTNTKTPTPTPTMTATPTPTPSPYVPGPLTTNGLALYLDANNSSSYNGSGTIWYDLTINGNNATMSGTSNPTFTTSGSTKYFTLNPTGKSQNQYFIVPDSNSLDVSTGVTMEFWIYYNNIGGGYASVINKQDPSGWEAPYGAYDFRFWFDKAEMWIAGYFAGPNYQTDTNSPYNGLWKQFVVTWSNSDYKYRFYTNGVLRSLSSATTATSIQNTPYPLWIGADASGVSENFTGNMSIIRLYDRALSSTEVNNNFYYDRSKFGL